MFADAAKLWIKLLWYKQGMPAFSFKGRDNDCGRLLTVKLVQLPDDVQQERLIHRGNDYACRRGAYSCHSCFDGRAFPRFVGFVYDFFYVVRAEFL